MDDTLMVGRLPHFFRSSLALTSSMQPKKACNTGVSGLWLLGSKIPELSLKLRSELFAQIVDNLPALFLSQDLLESGHVGLQLLTASCDRPH